MFYLVKKVLFKRRSFHAIHQSRGALKQLSKWRDLVSKLGIQLFVLSTASLSENLELELLENGSSRHLLLKKMQRSETCYFIEKGGGASTNRPL